MAYAHLSGRNIQNHFRDKKGIKTGGSIAFGKVHYLVLEGDQPSDTASQYHADAIGVDIIPGKARIFHSLITGYQCKLRVTVYLTRFLPIEKVGRFKILYFTSKPGSELRGIELGNRCCA